MSRPSLNDGMLTPVKCSRRKGSQERFQNGFYKLLLHVKKSKWKIRIPTGVSKRFGFKYNRRPYKGRRFFPKYTLK